MSRRLTGIFIVALAALTVPVSFAVAGSGGGGAKAVGVERHVDPTMCGVSQGVPYSSPSSLRRYACLK